MYPLPFLECRQIGLHPPQGALCIYAEGFPVVFKQKLGAFLRVDGGVQYYHIGHEPYAVLMGDYFFYVVGVAYITVSPGETAAGLRHLALPARDAIDGVAPGKKDFTKFPADAVRDPGYEIFFIRHPVPF